MMVVGITKEEVSIEDEIELENLSFTWNFEYDCWTSVRFGSA
jgi:hypothetical protein